MTICTHRGTTTGAIGVGTELISSSPDAAGRVGCSLLPGGGLSDSLAGDGSGVGLRTRKGISGATMGGAMFRRGPQAGSMRS
jgi:hypothetical protein